MRLAIYGRGVNEVDIPALTHFFSFLEKENIPFLVQAGYHTILSPQVPIINPKLFSTVSDLQREKVQFIVSMGGDGTLLDTLNFIQRANIPVLGINLGRLGFLSGVAREDATEAIIALLKGQFTIEKRSLLELHSDSNYFGEMNFALNDFAIHKRDTGAMITIDTFLNGEFFTSYWADGLIVSTPTGSTAYSLSCGGPIIFPDSGNFVLTPVAPHNLNIRPIIVADTTVISFKIKGRGNNHLISMDSRYEIIEYSHELAVQKAGFFFNLVKLNGRNFINTLREKLGWGLDSRNF